MEKLVEHDRGKQLRKYDLIKTKKTKSENNLDFRNDKAKNRYHDHRENQSVRTIFGRIQWKHKYIIKK